MMVRGSGQRCSLKDVPCGAGGARIPSLGGTIRNSHFSGGGAWDAVNACPIVMRTPYHGPERSILIFQSATRAAGVLNSAVPGRFE